jgi:hypothetical protein
MTALSGTYLPAIAADKKTHLRKKVTNTAAANTTETRGIQPKKWKLILGRVAAGQSVPEAIKMLGIRRSALEGHLLSDKSAKDQLNSAKVQALLRIWSDDMFEEALVAIAMGSTVRQACEQVGLGDRVETFYKLVMRDENCKEAYEEARMIQAEKMAIDDIIEISDDDKLDETFEGKPNAAAVNRSRLKVDSRKWIASKLHYKRFGDRIQQDIEQNVTIDHAARLEAARKRRDEAFSKAKK